MIWTRRNFLTNSALLFGSAHAFALDMYPALPHFGVIPSPRQLLWHEMEMYSFLHFTVNTFTDKEWGYGDEDPSIFNPVDFDADAIVLALKSANMKGVILTCKHHDGFCLWPTKATEHCIRNSKWRNGKGDIVREISNAARRHGLKFGVYVSPWDRNNSAYGTSAYLPIYRQQITELLTNYGTIAEVWFDGANGGDGYYGGAKETRTIDKHTYYDWPDTWAIVRRLQPNAVMFSDAGPDIRWVGNESGIAGDPCWATFDPIAEDGGIGVPGDIQTKQSSSGTRNGSHWIPAECDVSIRPGWFWHEAENSKVKTPQQLFDLYLRSVGRGASLLLNVPPNRNGLLSAEDITSLRGFGQLLNNTFGKNLAAEATIKASDTRDNSKLFGVQNLTDDDSATYWVTNDAVKTAELIINLPRQAKIQFIRIREAIALGQHIGTFSLDIWKNNAWSEIAQGTSIGACRILQFAEAIETAILRLRITDAAAFIALTELGIY